MTLFFTILLTSCSNQNLDLYKDQNPVLDLKNFFSGKIRALGIVQDRSGQVIKRFEVDINASWSGDTATLDESFDYSDGTKGKRIWTLKQKKDSTYEGTAHDVIETAYGKTVGNTFFFEYVLNLPVGDTQYKVLFEDWMYLLDSKTLLARSYMKKWGLKLGEVTIVMMKVE